MTLTELDVTAVRRWSVLLRAALATRRDEIDSLNVFPVPDGDTGTNMYLTFDTALEAIHEEVRGATKPAEIFTALSREILLAARGNSGVILSEMIRGFGDAVGQQDVLDTEVLIAAIQRANDRAWAAVSTPVEGTILSVSAAAAEVASGMHGASIAELAQATAEAARQALARTPEQLEALAHAGVVDAGGAGFVLVLESLDRLVSGDDSRLRISLGPDGQRWHRNGEVTWAQTAHRDALAGGGEGDAPAQSPAFEVMFLLEESDTDRVEHLKATLGTLGDSLLIIGADPVWKVHVHVDDAGAAVEAGIAAGKLRQIRITHLLGVDGRHEVPDTHHAQPSEGGVAVVACAAGDGIAHVLAEAGATVVSSGPGGRASTGQLLNAIQQALRSGASSVVVLPNDKDTLLAAGAAVRAAHDEGQHVEVVKARTAVQGIAALAVFDPHKSLAENVLAMQSASAATKHGAVTIASKDALTTAGWCHVGDVLGIIDGDIVLLGDDLATVAGLVVDRLVGSGGELLTILHGSAATPELVEAVSEHMRQNHRAVDVEAIYGGQPSYHLLLGVE